MDRQEVTLRVDEEYRLVVPEAWQRGDGAKWDQAFMRVPDLVRVGLRRSMGDVRPGDEFTLTRRTR